MAICVCSQNIIHSSTSVGDEMTHYLYVLQTLRLNLLEHRMRTPLDSYSQVCFWFQFFNFWTTIWTSLFELHYSCFPFIRTRGKCCTGCVRLRLRWRARATWAAREDTRSALKSLRSSDSLWVQKIHFVFKTYRINALFTAFNTSGNISNKKYFLFYLE